MAPVKDISALELEEEMKCQNELIAELSDLSSVLKENILEMRHTVSEQNKVLTYVLDAITLGRGEGEG